MFKERKMCWFTLPCSQILHTYLLSIYMFYIQVMNTLRAHQTTKEAVRCMRNSKKYKIMDGPALRFMSLCAKQYCNCIFTDHNTRKKGSFHSWNIISSFSIPRLGDQRKHYNMKASKQSQRRLIDSDHVSFSFLSNIVIFFSLFLMYYALYHDTTPK